MLLLFAFQVVLGEVTTLALPIGVMRLVRMRADISHLGLAPAVVALVTHVLCILFLVRVGTGISGLWLLDDLLELGLMLL